MLLLPNKALPPPFLPSRRRGGTAAGLGCQAHWMETLMARTKKPLRTCPQCRHSFVTRNMWHRGGWAGACPVHQRQRFPFQRGRVRKSCGSGGSTDRRGGRRCRQHKLHRSFSGDGARPFHFPPPRTNVRTRGGPTTVQTAVRSRGTRRIGELPVGRSNRSEFYL